MAELTLLDVIKHPEMAGEIFGHIKHRDYAMLLRTCRAVHDAFENALINNLRSSVRNVGNDHENWLLCFELCQFRLVYFCPVSVFWENYLSIWNSMVNRLRDRKSLTLKYIRMVTKKVRLISKSREEPLPRYYHMVDLMLEKNTTAIYVNGISKDRDDTGVMELYFYTCILVGKYQLASIVIKTGRLENQDFFKHVANQLPESKRQNYWIYLSKYISSVKYHL